MISSSPITPPTELVEKWHDAWIDAKVKHNGLMDFIATQAAQWGADQELEACRDWLFLNGYGYASTISKLITARRPKPPSLKEQALAALEVIPKLVGFESERDTIRAALEALDD